MWSLPLVRHTDVPPKVTESFILSGYRFPNYSLRQCLASAFRPTNETGNFWTHFLPIFVFAFYFLEVFAWEGAPEPSSPFFYPFWNYCLGVFYLLLASSLAHLLNSMSLIIREICFFVDYGTISAYTVGSSLAYYYYIYPQAGIPEIGVGGRNASHKKGLNIDDETWPSASLSPRPSIFCWFFENLYIPTSCLVAIVCVITCCNTRQRWRKYRYAVRTLVFILPFFISSTPVFYRLLSPSPYIPHSSSSMFSTMPAFFYRHCFWLVVSAIFNISKIPERFSPGYFDIWGHSHQWFHCCTFLSILDELHMIKVEMRALLLSPALVLSPAIPPRLPGPTFCSTYGIMVLLQGCIASVIGWFGWCAYYIYAPEQKMLKGH
ncbi:membrane progesterone receptor epsilon [Misgurnus anguillicaudatus]|uniref:membrane progesterone receptor epsilon n=1 Tax=Misgurnus anguillicaudatus TaxID=75329 RepID=UPI0024357B8C|nr:membrane progesterone receptor epsilon [Misgurnus anguillicaudatus]